MRKTAYIPINLDAYLHDALANCVIEIVYELVDELPDRWKMVIEHVRIVVPSSLLQRRMGQLWPLADRRFRNIRHDSSKPYKLAGFGESLFDELTYDKSGGRVPVAQVNNRLLEVICLWIIYLLGDAAGIIAPLEMLTSRPENMVSQLRNPGENGSPEGGASFLLRLMGTVVNKSPFLQSLTPPLRATFPAPEPSPLDASSVPVPSLLDALLLKAIYVFEAGLQYPRKRGYDKHAPYLSAYSYSGFRELLARYWLWWLFAIDQYVNSFAPAYVITLPSSTVISSHQVRNALVAFLNAQPRLSALPLPAQDFLRRIFNAREHYHQAHQKKEEQQWLLAARAFQATGGIFG